MAARGVLGSIRVEKVPGYARGPGLSMASHQQTPAMAHTHPPAAPVMPVLPPISRFSPPPPAPPGQRLPMPEPVRHYEPIGGAIHRSISGPELARKRPDPLQQKRPDPTEMVVSRMVEAVLLQAEAIVEIRPHRPCPSKTARVQGGWETVRVLVSRSADDTTAEAAMLDTVVWPELRARCAARRLHLLAIDARQGMPDDGVSPTACLGQVASGSSCNDGVPFLLVVQGASTEGWVPVAHTVTPFGDGWVHGMSLGAMEAFEAVCRMRSSSVLVLTRGSRSSSAAGPHHAHGDGGAHDGAHALPLALRGGEPA